MQALYAPTDNLNRKDYLKFWGLLKTNFERKASSVAIKPVIN